MSILFMLNVISFRLCVLVLDISKVIILFLCVVDFGY